MSQKYDSRLIGNIGNPVLAEKQITKKTIFVIEASSYQLDYSQIFTSKYALILNISPDHLERHKNLKNYVNAKFKLLNSQTNKSIALVKENDPLFFYKKILNFSKKNLISNGTIYFEINENFSKQVNKLLKKEGFHDIIVRKDLRGKYRMVKATKK